MADSGSPSLSTSQLDGTLPPPMNEDAYVADQSAGTTPVNGTDHEKTLSPAQQRQLEADKPEPESSTSTYKRPRKPSTPPNLLSEGDFPTLGSVKTPFKPVTAWGAGAKRSPASVSSPPSAAVANGVNGKVSSNSSRASTPAPASRAPALPGSRSLHSSTGTEHVRLRKDQLQLPNAKDFAAVCDKVKKLTGVDNIAVTRMKMSEIVTFSITGKHENNVKAKARLLNEVGIKVVYYMYC
jgi:hypothetical protein